MNRKEIRKFVDSLANTNVNDNSTNQFSYDKEENEIRRTNLIEYLLAMRELNPKNLLVSEAPGYLGMRKTGIPFTSEKTIDSHSFFKTKKEIKIENTNKITTEQSATIVWNTIDEIHTIPLMWPSFPFHPHQTKDKNSNRKPTTSELGNCITFLKQIIEKFGIPETGIIAVGRVAENTLKELNIEAKYLRHPANGGAKKFNEQLKEMTS